MCSRSLEAMVKVCPDTLEGVSDHSALAYNLPIAAGEAPREPMEAPSLPFSYRWIEGDNLSEYANAWHKWRSHTNSAPFCTKFATLQATHAGNVDDLVTAFEDLLLAEALELEVVRKVVHTRPRNPNKHSKALAPWFSDACRTAKHAYLAAVRSDGRDSTASVSAYRSFKKICHSAKS